MNYILRRTAPKDIDELVMLEETCFKESRISRRSFRYLISKAQAESLAIVAEGKIGGYAMVFYRANSKRARLYSIAVLPKYRKHGFAKILLSAVEQLAKKRHCREITLEVREDNDIARRFYQSEGYVKLCLLKNYYEDQMTAIRMIKTL